MVSQPDGQLGGGGTTEHPVVLLRIEVNDSNILISCFPVRNFPAEKQALQRLSSCVAWSDHPKEDGWSTTTLPRSFQGRRALCPLCRHWLG